MHLEKKFNFQIQDAMWHIEEKEISFQDRKYRLRIQYEVRKQRLMTDKKTISFYEVSMYYVLFDLTNTSSFNDAQTMITFLTVATNPNAIKYLIGNKVDLEEDREIQEDQAKVIFFNTKLKQKKKEFATSKGIFL